MSTNEFKDMGMLIKSFRQSKKWSAEEFKDMLGISLVTLSRLENGHRGPTAGVIKSLISLGMNVEDLTSSARAHTEEQSLSYRLAEVENQLKSMESIIKKLLKKLDEKEGK